MAHAQAASFQRLIAALRARSGEWCLDGVTPQGEQVRLSVLHGATQSTVRLEAGQRGVSALSTANDTRLVVFADSLRQGLSPSWNVAVDAAQQLHTSVDNYDLWRWLKGVDISPTLLVIPGISALRSKIPAVDLGPVSLPDCVASVSLRSIAIDLHNGAISGTLTIDDARFNGEATVVIGQGMRAAIESGRLVLTLEFTYSYWDGSGSLWLQSMVGTSSSCRIEASVSNAKPAVAIKSGPVRLSMTDVWYSFDSNQSQAESGEIRLECSKAVVTAAQLALGEQVSIVGPRLEVDQATILSQLRGSDAAVGLVVDARLSRVAAAFDEIKLAPSADFSVEGIATGLGDALRADSMLIDLAGGEVREMSAGVSVAYSKALYKKAGVSVEVQASAKNLLVLSVARDALSDQYGFRAKVESATIFAQDLGVKVPLKNIKPQPSPN